MSNLQFICRHNHELTFSDVISKDRTRRVGVATLKARTWTTDGGASIGHWRSDVCH